VGPEWQLAEGLQGEGLAEHVQVDPWQLGQPQAAAVLGQQARESALDQLWAIVHHLLLLLL